MLTILQGDAIDQLRTLPDESVHCCVSSPPYWGLRDYGTAQWEGGDDGCDHADAKLKSRYDYSLASSPIQDGTRTGTDAPRYKDSCPCGAKRIDSQLGLEKTPEEYVAKMVEVFREVRRVLRKDGTLWLNLGDSYAANEKGSGNRSEYDENYRNSKSHTNRGNEGYKIRVNHGLKPKDLCGIPWRVAFALQADGWWLRSDIIWAKPNPMPESVTDRPTKAHEYLFLLTKASSYFYDAEAIKEESEQNRWGGHKAQFENSKGGYRGLNHDRDMMPSSRNKRSVWTVATAPYPEAHFATYPPDLIKPCILAGTSAKGCCAKCGSPWERIVEKSGGTIGKSWHNHEDDLGRGQRGGDNGNVAADAWSKGDYKVETIGWQPTCKCAGHKILEMEIGQSGGITELLTEPVPVHTIPCTVLDPFAGSGTTGAVALELGRKAVLIELNPKYVEIIRQRCNITPGLQLA